jgi:hypothetical protein
MDHPHRSDRKLESFAHPDFVACVPENQVRTEAEGLRKDWIAGFLAILCSLTALGLMAGCSTTLAHPETQTPLISVAFTQTPPASMIVGNSTTVSATVANDPANAGVDWVATCASAPKCGTFSPSHTASGATSTYTAPFGVPGKNTVAVTALSTTDRSKTSASTVTITSTVTGIVITSPLPASVPAGSILNLGATVAGDPANLGVDWTATCPTVIGPVVCSPSLHSSVGGTVPFTVPQTLIVPGVGQISLLGTSITITALATADHTFSAMAVFTVTAGISINITQAPPATLLTNATAPVTAVVTDDTSNSGVDWVVQCQAPPCGTVAPSHTASGVPAIFTAPPTVPSPNPPPGFPVGITAYATATGMSLQSSVTVDIVAPVSVKITQGVTNNTIVANASAPLVAAVSNDFANAGVNWAVTCGSAGACGSFSLTPAHTASGAPITYTAPTTVPTGGTVTITATSTTDPTQSDQQIVTVTGAPPPNSLLQGQFVVLLTARNSQNGPFVFGGVISGDGNGNVTAGNFDLADTAGNAAPPTLLALTQPSTSTYSIGLDGRGQIQLTLNTGGLNSSFGVSAPGATTGTLTLSVVFVTPQHALLSETDSFGDATGTLDLQNAADLASFQNGSAGLNGTYSLQLSGTELASHSPGYFVAASLAFQTSGGSYTLTGSTADLSANGAITSVPFAATSQVFSNPVQNFGRIPLPSLNLGLPKNFNPDLWLIDANHFMVIDWLDATAGPFVLTAGYLTIQPASPSLSGTFAFTEAGATSAAQPPVAPQVAGGILTCGSTGTLDVVPLGGAVVSSQPNTTCTAPTNGRATITVSGATTAGISLFAAYPTLDQGFYLIELDGGAAGTSGPSGAGVAFQQTLSQPISASAFSGAYASNFTASTALGSQAFSAQITSDGVSTITGAADVNSFNTTPPSAATPSPSATLNGSYTAGSDGRFPLTLTILPAIPSLNPVCYIVDANTCLLLGLDPTAPGTGILLLQKTGL